MTALLEFAEQAEFDTLLIAVGGGGPDRRLRRRDRLVEEDRRRRDRGHADPARGAKAKPVDVAISGIAADALGASRIGTPNFEVARTLVRDFPCWSPTGVRETQRVARDELRTVAEPAGATGLAALRAGAHRPAPGERVATLICGANTDQAR